MNLIVDYLEGKITPEVFFSKLYDNEKLRKELENEVNIPPYTNEDNALIFLLSRNPKNLEFLIDAEALLVKFLEKRNISFKKNNKYRLLYNAFLDVQPNWIDVSFDYFSDVLEKMESEPLKTIKQAIKAKIKTDFVCLKNKPKWLQSPNWPIKNGIPLIFAGEIDISKISHDTTKIFVFIDKLSFEIVTIKQSL